MPLAEIPGINAQFMYEESVTFSWTRSDTAEHYDFHLFNATNSDISEYYYPELKPSDVCTVETCSINLTVRLPVSNRHAWRVRAGNVAGKSNWTRTIFSILPVEEPTTAQ